MWEHMLSGSHAKSEGSYYIDGPYRRAQPWRTRKARLAARLAEGPPSRALDLVLSSGTGAECKRPSKRKAVKAVKDITARARTVHCTVRRL